MIDVLLVDDEDAILEVAQTYLESDGDIYAKTACSALEAIKLLSHWDYDLIISDYSMPGGDGIELLKALRRRGNNVPFVLFTAKDRGEIEGEIMPLGHCQIVEKGANVKHTLPYLKRTARECVRRSRMATAQGRDEHVKSILETYVHDDDAIDVIAESFEDPVPSWMRGSSCSQPEDATVMLEERPYVTLAMLENLPAKRLRKGAIALPPMPQSKDRLSSGSVRFGGGLKLLREDVGLREAGELMHIKDEAKYVR